MILMRNAVWRWIWPMIVNFKSVQWMVNGRRSILFMYSVPNDSATRKTAAYRLLLSPNLVAVDQSVGYGTWALVGRHYLIYCLELPHLQWTVGLPDLWEFPPFNRDHWQSPSCLPVGLCKETVEETRPHLSATVTWSCKKNWLSD